jgi:hypothetical protein
VVGYTQYGAYVASLERIHICVLTLCVCVCVCVCECERVRGGGVLNKKKITLQFLSPDVISAVSLVLAHIPTPNTEETCADSQCKSSIFSCLFYVYVSSSECLNEK